MLCRWPTLSFRKIPHRGGGGLGGALGPRRAARGAAGGLLAGCLELRRLAALRGLIAAGIGASACQPAGRACIPHAAMLACRQQDALRERLYPLSCLGGGGLGASGARHRGCADRPCSTVHHAPCRADRRAHTMHKQKGRRATEPAPVPAMLEDACVPCGLTEPACCCVPAPWPPGLAPANWKDEGVNAAGRWGRFWASVEVWKPLLHFMHDMTHCASQRKGAQGSSPEVPAGVVVVTGTVPAGPEAPTKPLALLV